MSRTDMKEMEQKTQNSKKGNEKKSMVFIKEALQKFWTNFLKNIGLKLIALLCAFLLWTTIININDPYITVEITNIPVTVLNENALQEQGKISDIESGRSITIKVKAPKSIADNLNARDFEAFADYQQMSLVYAVPIQVSVSGKSSYAREDISIITKSPEMMILTLEDYASETFRVDIAASGEAAEGYYVADMLVKPSLIQISGSRKQIDRIERVVVEIGTARVSKSFSTVAGLKVYDKNGYQIDESTIELEAKEVEVEVTVLPVKSILLLVTIEGEPGYGYECTVVQHVPTEITIAGTEENLKKIYSMTIPFDISMQTKDVETRLNIENYLLENYGEDYVLVDEEKYVTVKAVIEKLPITDIKVSSEDIEIRNLPKNCHLLFTKKNDINIKVMGSEEELARLTAQSLKLYIDVEDYDPGKHFVSVYSDTDAMVTVREGTVGIEITEVQDTFKIGGNAETGLDSPEDDTDTDQDSPPEGGGPANPEDGIDADMVPEDLDLINNNTDMEDELE